MAKFKIIDEGDGFYTVKDVPIFEMHDDRGFPCDEQWMMGAIENHKKYKTDGFRPMVIIGHNTAGKEKESVGFLDRLVLKGRRLYTDLVRVPREIKEKLVRNSYPNRSVEVLPKSRRILALALLGGTTPHFTLPQMAYEQESNETSLWFRSPVMLEFTDEMKKELFAHVGEAVKMVLPAALEKYNAGNGEVVDTPEIGDEQYLAFTDNRTGETYAVPAAVAATLGKLKGAGKVAAGLVKKHPAAAAGGAGFVAGRASKKGYALDIETGVLYFDGQPIGEVLTYQEMAEAGMSVPTAVKRPHDLPSGPQDIDPQLEISEEDVGIDTGTDDTLTNEPGGIAGDVIQPLNRDTSEQFADQRDKLIYDLQHRVEKVETANALLATGRRAEAYKQWLTEQKRAGTPVGDIDKAIDFMMSLSPTQVEAHKKLLLTQPKVAFEKQEEVAQTFTVDNLDATKIRADYEKNKELYQALGVSDKDLEYVQYVRVNQAVGEIQA